MFNNLHIRIEEYIAENNEASISFQKFMEHENNNNTPLILTIVTPLMKRAHIMVSKIDFKPFF